MAVQQRFEVVDLALGDGALGQQDDIDAARLLAGGDQHPIQQVQVEPFGRGELEESVRVLGQPLHIAHRVKVGCLYSQRPRQQQQGGVLGAQVGAAMAGRDLVPAGVDAGALHAGVARKRRSSRGRSDDLGQDAQQAGVDAGQRPGAGQQLAAAGPIPTDGPLLFADALAGCALAAILLAWPRPLAGLLRAGFMASTLAALILSINVGLFGFQESIRASFVVESILLESLGAAVLLTWTVMTRKLNQSSKIHPTLDRNRRRGDRRLRLERDSQARP